MMGSSLETLGQPCGADIGSFADSATMRGDEMGSVIEKDHQVNPVHASCHLFHSCISIRPRGHNLVAAAIDRG
jgi:hypothetical protein